MTQAPRGQPWRTIPQRLVLRVERIRRVREEIERGRARSPHLDVAFATIERDSEIGGGILGGALAYRLFLFALPLGFFLVSVLGLVAEAVARSPRGIGTDLGLTGVVTKEVSSAASGSSNWWVAISSVAVLAWVSRKLCRAFSVVHALAWHQSAALAKKPRLRSVGVFDVVILGEVALVGLVGLARHQTRAGGAAALLASAVVVVGLWCIVSLQLPHATAGWRDLLPGALLYGTGFVLVQAFNVYLLGTILESKASTYGTLGAAAAILLSLFFVGRLAVLAAVLNATLFERRAAATQEARQR